MKFSQEFLKGYESAIRDMKILSGQGISDPGEITYTLIQDLKEMLKKSNER